MAFQDLKNACKGGLKYRKFDELEHGEYIVKSFAIKQMVFGMCVCAYFDDFYVVLPDRFMQLIGQRRKIEELNAGRCKMVYSGKDENRNGFIEVDFIQLGVDNH